MLGISTTEIKRVRLGPPTENTVSAFADRCVPSEKQRVAENLIKKHVWMRQSWHALAIIRDIALSQAHLTAMRVAEIYFDLCRRQGKFYLPTYELLVVFGYNVMTQLYGSDGDASSLYRDIRMDLATKNYATIFSFGQRDPHSMIDTWNRLGFATWDRDKNALTGPDQSLAALCAGVAFADLFSLGRIDLAKLTQRQWRHCIPNALEYWELHGRFDSLDQFAEQVEACFKETRAHNRVKGLLAQEWQIAEALQQLSSLGRFRLSGLVAYLSDALIDEIVGQIEAAQGVLAKLMKDRQQQIDAYVRKLVELLRVLDRNGLVKLGLEIQADTATEGNELIQKLAMHMIAVGTRLN